MSAIALNCGEVAAYRGTRVTRRRILCAEKLLCRRSLTGRDKLSLPLAVIRCCCSCLTRAAPKEPEA
jgi:hypothetical protein